MSNKEISMMLAMSAKKSQIDWQNTTPLKRSRILSNYKNLIEENIDVLAKLVSREHGKALMMLKDQL